MSRVDDRVLSEGICEGRERGEKGTGERKEGSAPVSTELVTLPVRDDRAPCAALVICGLMCCALAVARSDHRNFALRVASLVLQSEQLMQRLLDSPVRR